MLKRVLMLLGVLFILSTYVTADVVVKDTGNGNVEVIFTYDDNSTEEMNVIGSFNSWTEPGDAMTKNSAGIWEYRLPATMDDEFIYKFFHDGNYISDENAPDEKDDGFGGMNGLVIVSDLVSMAPTTDGTPAAPVVKRQKTTFGTTTYVESSTNIDSDSVVDAKSVWKFSGDLVKNMPGYIELTFFEGSNTIYQKDTSSEDEESNEIKLEDGLESLGSGFLFNPAYYLGGYNRPVLDAFGFGFDTKFVSYYSGYGSTTFKEHTSTLWNTVDGDYSAEDGYSLITTDQDIGPLNIYAGIAPNKSNQDYYGYYTYVQASIAGIEAEFFYDMQSGTTDTPEDIFTDIPRQNIDFGLTYKNDLFSVSGELLTSEYTAGGTAMDRPSEDRLAAEVQFNLTHEFADLSVGYKNRGIAAQLIYMDNDDVLGSADTSTIYLDSTFNMLTNIIPGMNVKVVTAGDEAEVADLELNVKPFVTISELTLAGQNFTTDFYTEIGLTQTEGSDDTYSIKTGLAITNDLLTVNYGLEKGDNIFNSLLLGYQLPADVKAEIGVGYWMGDEIENTFGFATGLDWKVPSAKGKYPHVYINYQKDLNAYSTGGESLSTTDYRLNSSITEINQISAGISWDF